MPRREATVRYDLPLPSFEQSAARDLCVGRSEDVAPMGSPAPELAPTCGSVRPMRLQRPTGPKRFASSHHAVARWISWKWRWRRSDPVFSQYRTASEQREAVQSVVRTAEQVYRELLMVRHNQSASNVDGFPLGLLRPCWVGKALTSGFSLELITCDLRIGPSLSKNLSSSPAA